MAQNVKDNEGKRNEAETGHELSHEQLEQVTGGAVDYFLALGGIQGESQDENSQKPL
jgi:bacteriocin-like protein